MSSADADDPPRSRLFVVCPKGTGQDTLQRAFEDLLAKLSADPPPAARETTTRKDPDEDARDENDDGLEEDDVGDEPRDKPPLVKHLESVRVVPRKGVAFAKFSDAATARRCMAAIADANGALGALRVKCMLAEPKVSAGVGAGPAERANGTPTPPPPPPGGGGGGGGAAAAAAASGVAAAAGGGAHGGGVATGSRPRGERSGEPPGGSASPKRARRGGDGSRGGFPPPPHQTTPVVASENQTPNQTPSANRQTGTRPSPASSEESGGGFGRGIGRSPVRNPHSPSPPIPPGPPPGVFLGEAWMGDGRRGALVFHPRGGGVPTFRGADFHPAAPAPPPPHYPAPHYPAPAFAHHPHVGGATWHHPHHPHHPPLPPDWPPPSPARSGASSALSGGGGGGTHGGTHGGGGPSTPTTTSADSDSVRSNGGGVSGSHKIGRRAFVVLDKTVTQSTLESLFRDTCEGVVQVELKTDGESGRSRGFAYVTFDAPARVNEACERLNGRELPEGSGVRCKVMPALDREPRRTPERSGSNKRRSNGNGNGNSNGRGGSGSAAAGASSGEGADRSTRTDARRPPSPSPDSDAKKKTRFLFEEKGFNDGGDDDDAQSWQLPGPRKYSRLNSPSAGDVADDVAEDADDDAIREEEEEEEEEEVDDEDEDEAESGLEAASSSRRLIRREASRSKAEEEATDAAMALGKVSLGVVAEEDVAAAAAAEGDGSRREEGTDAELLPDGKSPDDLDEFDGDGDGELAAGGDDGPGGNRTRDISDRDDEALRPDESVPAAKAKVVLFFRLALPLPSYALRHVLASHGEVADLSMAPDGASGRVEYRDEEGADAALEALHATEILGIELRTSRREADVAGTKAATGPEGVGADQRKKRTRRA